MKIIHINVDVIQDALRLSVNATAIVKSIRDLIGEGFVLEVVQEFHDAPVTKLFALRSVEEYNKWIIAGAPAVWSK